MATSGWASVATLPRVAWDNAALSLLERTLDDSANRRLILPEALLLTDEVLRKAEKLVAGLRIWPGPSARNLRDYGVFAATERVLMAAVKAGGDRQVLHEVIRGHSLAAWAELQAGGGNTLAEGLAGDDRITKYLAVEAVRSLLDASEHVGDAPERSLAFAAAIRQALGGE